ncbi:hypothetical protein G6F65_020710 [Rhizopus arrhizus]|nr:hypothetical protein G6F32_015429 [Rhizopus arrhizus]KAG1246396.1 hypothetical protein G6F65_020710 [Rhizopus arrhizus]
MPGKANRRLTGVLERSAHRPESIRAITSSVPKPEENLISPLSFRTSIPSVSLTISSRSASAFRVFRGGMLVAKSVLHGCSAAGSAGTTSCGRFPVR